MIDFQYIIFFFGLAFIGFLAWILFNETTGSMFSQNPDHANMFFASGEVVEGTYNGIKYQYFYDDGYPENLFQVFHYKSRRKYPPFLRLTLEIPTLGEFELVKKKFFSLAFFTNFFAQLYVVDKDFDKHCSVSSNQDVFLTSGFWTPTRRKSVKELFALGFTQITSSKNKLEAKSQPFFAFKDHDTHFITRSISILFKLGSASSNPHS
jgi:hypothetical protein